MSATSISSVVTLSATGTVTAGSPVTAICTITNSGTAPSNAGYTVLPTAAVHSGSAGPSLPVILGSPVYSSPILLGSGVASGVTIVTFLVTPRSPITSSPSEGSATLSYDIGAVVNAVDSTTGAQLEATSTVATLTVGSIF